MYLRHEGGKLAAANQAQGCTSRSSLDCGSIAEGGHHHVCNSNSISTNSLSCCRAISSICQLIVRLEDLKRAASCCGIHAFWCTEGWVLELQLANRVCDFKNRDGKSG